jgi:hypothetical protein
MDRTLIYVYEWVTTNAVFKTRIIHIRFALIIVERKFEGSMRG